MVGGFGGGGASATWAELRIMRDVYPTDPNAPTLGTMSADGLGSILQTLEPPWRENAANISCIPEGTYPVALMLSPRFGRVMPHLTGVPDRDAIEIHAGNFVADTHGCVLVGMERGAEGQSVYRSHEALGLVLGWLNRALAAGSVMCRIERLGRAA